MVFGNRIVSTDVNGIAEMLTNTDEAYLVPAGDQFKLANALEARARRSRGGQHARCFRWPAPAPPANLPPYPRSAAPPPGHPRSLARLSRCMSPPDWKSAIEIHPDNWRCPAEPFWIAGWATSRHGLVPVDVRAWLGPQPFLGLCGLPRPDKGNSKPAASRRARRRPAFPSCCTPWPARPTLRVEICDQHGRWTEIFRQAVTMPGNFSCLRVPSPAPVRAGSVDTSDAAAPAPPAARASRPATKQSRSATSPRKSSRTRNRRDLRCDAERSVQGRA